MSISKAIGAAVLVGTAAMLTGCANAPIPVAENFQYTSQQKVRSAGHWELVSRDVVAQTLGTLKIDGGQIEITALHRPLRCGQQALHGRHLGTICQLP